MADKQFVRDDSIDILRFIGISMIILVHCGAPGWLTQLRCFDVPLMFFVSGLACSGKEISNYPGYILKRAKRLLIPTWGFLLVFFALLVGALLLLHKELPANNYFIESFAMTGGIGYVWIMRIFLLVAMATPLLIRVNSKVHNDNALIICLLGILWGGELVIRLNPYYNAVPYLGRFINEWLIPVISYSILFLLGLRMRYSDQRRSVRITVWLAAIFGASLVVYYFSNGLPIKLSPNYKYPPHSYYILYGLMACSALWSVRGLLKKFLNCRLTRFIGRNTVWIYLYHIPLLSLPIHVNWVFRYAIVYSVSVLIFALQYAVYERLKDRFPIVKYLVG